MIIQDQCCPLFIYKSKHFPWLQDLLPSKSLSSSPHFLFYDDDESYDGFSLYVVLKTIKIIISWKDGKSDRRWHGIKTPKWPCNMTSWLSLLYSIQRPSWDVFRILLPLNTTHKYLLNDCLTPQLSLWVVEYKMYSLKKVPDFK